MSVVRINSKHLLNSQVIINQGPVAKQFKLTTCSLRLQQLLRIGRRKASFTLATLSHQRLSHRSWPRSTSVTRKRLVAVSLRMCNLIVHTSDSDASDQSRCDLDASVYDTLDCNISVVFLTLALNIAENYWLHRKMLQTKVTQNLISCKKLSGSISLSPPAVKLGRAKHLPCTEMEN